MAAESGLRLRERFSLIWDCEGSDCGGEEEEEGAQGDENGRPAHSGGDESFGLAGWDRWKDLRFEELCVRLALDDNNDDDDDDGVVGEGSRRYKNLKRCRKRMRRAVTLCTQRRLASHPLPLHCPHKAQTIPQHLCALLV